MRAKAPPHVVDSPTVVDAGTQTPRDAATQTEPPVEEEAAPKMSQAQSSPQLGRLDQLTVTFVSVSACFHNTFACRVDKLCVCVCKRASWCRVLELRKRKARKRRLDEEWDVKTGAPDKGVSVFASVAGLCLSGLLVRLARPPSE